jgi:uncharacterized protein (TIGR03067 family)
MPDLDKLQGTWHITALETDGDRTPSPALRGATVVVTGRTFVTTGAGERYEGTMTINEKTKPKSFDLVFTSGPQDGTRNLGIYKLAGDAWTICLAMRGTTRPAKFATTPHSGLALETLQRAETSEKASAARGRATSGTQGTFGTPGTLGTPAPQGPPTELEGEWTMTAGVFNGAPLDRAMVAYCRRVTRGDVTTVFAGPKIMMTARFTLDASSAPRAIDYVNLEGASAGKSQMGIYEMTGDELQISMAAPGKPRPQNFATAKGDGRTLTRFRKK